MTFNNKKELTYTDLLHKLHTNPAADYALTATTVTLYVDGMQFWANLPLPHERDTRFDSVLLIDGGAA